MATRNDRRRGLISSEGGAGYLGPDSGHTEFRISWREISTGILSAVVFATVSTLPRGFAAGSWLCTR